MLSPAYRCYVLNLVRIGFMASEMSLGNVDENDVVVVVVVCVCVMCVYVTRIYHSLLNSYDIILNY